MQSLVRAGQSARGPYTVSLDPPTAGWRFSGLKVIELAPGESHSFTLVGDEGVLLPLAGGCTAVVDGVTVDLIGRPGVFSGPSDFAYLPLGSQVTLTASKAMGSSTPCRCAVATARATRRLPLQVRSATDVRVDLRGAGPCSRQVNNYTLGTDVEVDRLLVCEVVTPGGNWCSYPPHKDDVHTENERELEEIYYFEVEASPDGSPGLAYHRVYSADNKPVDVLAEVGTGDIVLVPHGYHGPSMAAPGYDLYYLNVMAGPAEDGRWLSTDDPAHSWVRGTWADHAIDPRLLAPAHPAGQPQTPHTDPHEDAS